MNDSMIIELFFIRNEQAIAETDKKYGKLCFRIAKNILQNNEDSEECVSDTYWGIWNRIPPTRPNHFMSFVCKIVRNLSLKKLDYNLATKRTQNVNISLSELENILPDKCIKPDIEYEELGEIISNFLQHETEEVRNVFIRKYFFFDSVGDIAKQYSFSESKVKSMLFHTRKKLSEYLRKEGIEV